jgi:hypothetical protein
MGNSRTSSKARWCVRGGGGGRLERIGWKMVRIIGLCLYINYWLLWRLRKLGWDDDVRSEERREEPNEEFDLLVIIC